MDWQNEKTVKFIEEYRSNAILWDHRLSDYKNNKKKMDILKKLAERFECGVPNLRKKIKNLRSQFHREHKALTKSSSGDSPIRRPKWYYYESLSFLLDVGLLREETFVYDNAIYEEMRNGSPDMEDSENTGDTASATTDAQTDQKSSISLNEVGLLPNVKEEPPSPKRQRNDYREEKVTVDDAYTIPKDSFIRDEFATYGEHVGNEIRNLQPRAQIYVKHLINNLLFNAAIGEYDNP